MKSVIHLASERGHVNHGWLDAHHSFSFASWQNPSRVRFGLLRVLNDDIVAPGMGFGTHPHDNMEIVTIPLAGALEHKDTMGNIGVIKPNEIQAMSAGSGLMHSEYNHSKTEIVNLLQIWVFPKLKDIEPRYEQRVFSAEDKMGKFKTIVAPVRSNDIMWINQDAYFSLGNFKAGDSVEYSIQKENNGAYIFLISGSVKIAGELLNSRDAIGLWEIEKFTLNIWSDAEILIIDVPMN